MSLSPLEKGYQEIVLLFVFALESHPVLSMRLDTYSQSPWLRSWDSPDPLNDILPTSESIVEVMYLDETPWNDARHHSPFLPSLCDIPLGLENFVSHNPMHQLQTPVPVHEVFSEGNMGNITETMPMEISIKPGIVENIHIGVSCSSNEIRVYIDLSQEFWDVFGWLYEEIPSIDPAIVVHEIPMYPNAKLCRISRSRSTNYAIY